MKKLLMIIITQFIFIGAANAVVNINTATQEELQTLPGITAARAEAIINYRSKAGAFRRVEDVKNIEGIEATTMDMMEFYNSVKLKDQGKPTYSKIKHNKFGRYFISGIFNDLSIKRRLNNETFFLYYDCGGTGTDFVSL